MKLDVGEEPVETESGLACITALGAGSLLTAQASRRRFHSLKNNPLIEKCPMFSLESGRPIIAPW